MVGGAGDGGKDVNRSVVGGAGSWGRPVGLMVRKIRSLLSMVWVLWWIGLGRMD